MFLRSKFDKKISVNGTNVHAVCQEIWFDQYKKEISSLDIIFYPINMRWVQKRIHTFCFFSMRPPMGVVLISLLPLFSPNLLSPKFFPWVIPFFQPKSPINPILPFSHFFHQISQISKKLTPISYLPNTPSGASSMFKQILFGTSYHFT